MTYMFTFEDSDHSQFWCTDENPINAVMVAAEYVGGLDDITKLALSKCETMDEALRLYNKLNYSDYYKISMVHNTELLWKK